MHKTAFLTVDDAPSPFFRHKIDFLKAAGIPAVFFCRGDLLETAYEAGAYALQQGFELSNHGYTHTRFSALSLDEITDELRRTEAALDHTYALAGIPRTRRLFRFPYGDNGQDNSPEHAEAIRTLLTNMGLSDGIGWDYSTDDWFLKPKYMGKQGISSVADLTARIDRDFFANPETAYGGVVLIHDQPETHTAFFEIVAHFISRGTTFAPLPDPAHLKTSQ